MRWWYHTLTDPQCPTVTQIISIENETPVDPCPCQDNGNLQLPQMTNPLWVSHWDGLSKKVRCEKPFNVIHWNVSMRLQNHRKEDNRHPAEPNLPGTQGPLMCWGFFCLCLFCFVFCLSWILHATMCYIKKKGVVTSILLMESWDKAACSARDEITLKKAQSQAQKKNFLKTSRVNDPAGNNYIYNTFL